MAMVEINRTNDFIGSFDDNPIACWEIFLLIAFWKDMLQIVNLIFKGFDWRKACWIGDLWETSLDMDIFSISHCTNS